MENNEETKQIVDKPVNSGSIRDAKGRIRPGMALNPFGKPKGTKHFATIFMEVLKEEIKLKDGRKMTKSRAMTEAMVLQAMKGNVHAFDSVADRVDGKPKQDMEIEVTAMPTPIYSGKSIKKVKRANP